MTIKTISINDTQLKNLGVFLGRVDLKGAEVVQFNELVNLFFQEEPQEKEPKKSK